MIAAAMLWSLDHHVERLAEDHARARRLAEGIGVEAPETNFVSIPDEPGLEERLAERGVLVSNLRPGWLRAVTYLGITDEDVDMAAQRMADVLAVRA